MPFERDERDWDWWESAAAAVEAAGTTWVWVASFSAGVATPRPSRASEGELLCAVRVKMCSKITKVHFVSGSFYLRLLLLPLPLLFPQPLLLLLVPLRLLLLLPRPGPLEGRRHRPPPLRRSRGRRGR